jgi:hypothetical protein
LGPDQREGKAVYDWYDLSIMTGYYDLDN